MIPAELCHYTKRGTALEEILFKKTIKFGLLRDTNDPRDSNSIPLSFSSKVEQEWNSEKISEIQDLATKIQLTEWKVLCLSKNIESKKFTGNNALFLKGYCKPHMWAQYAENNTGLCLIFDGKQLHKNIEKYVNERYKIYHGPVSYKNAYPTPDYLNISSLLESSKEEIEKEGKEEIRNYYKKNYKIIFLSKYLNWKNEAEYRWLIHNQTLSPEYVSIEGALKSVLVGQNFPKVYEPALIELCKELKVSAGRMFWFYGAPHPILDNIYKP